MSTTWVAATLLLFLGAAPNAAAQGQLEQVTGGPRCDKFERIFVIGDSFADIGNRDPNDSTYTAIGLVNQPWVPPYGRSRPGSKPDGRFSDGRVLSDFLADYMGLKPSPYRVMAKLPSPANVQDGINFAVGGAGVFDNVGFTKTGDQIAQLETVLSRGLYGSNSISDSLIFYAISGNDYAAYLRNGNSTDPFVVLAFVTKVVDQVAQDLRVLYKMGFRSFVVSKLAPVGCIPAFTAANGHMACDETSNVIAAVHNSKLFLHLTTSMPGARLIFLNNQIAFSTVVYNPYNPGRLRTCCSGVSAGKLCGDVDAAGKAQYTVCNASEQKQLFFWDEFHPTEDGWGTIFNLFVQATFPFLYTDGKSLPRFLGCH